ncbi:beta-1,6-N-acetylglucosaminyltransferase [Pedobacter sp. SAFR-022]|uniref:beta-1,6-N-acetylglucosaminyltransferase n=1 Tax=Pedobacter sp. SAFR-022 TaxID=3436861 RepID=UPI003F7DE20B
MQIAHLIVAHKNPEQLLRLLKRLQHPNFDLFVHIDKKIPIEQFSHIMRDAKFLFIKNRTACNWGGNSVLMSIIKSVREIVDSGKKYDFINVISGQDYPLMSTEKMLAFFQSNLGTSFISYDHASDSQWWQLARNRYEKYHFTDLNVPGKYLLQNIVNTLLPKRKFPFFKTLYGGSKSTWWTITGDCALYLVSTLEENRKLNSFLKYAWCTDEFVVATIIMNSPFRHKTENNNLRYIDWSEQKASPKTLTFEDLAAMKASNMVFARKFDIKVDVRILDMIDLGL